MESTKFNTISTHKVYRGPPGNQLLSFQNTRGNTCFVTIAINGFCDVACYKDNMAQKKKWSSFSCQNITEVCSNITQLRLLFKSGLLQLVTQKISLTTL